jgi:hypothetical protein
MLMDEIEKQNKKEIKKNKNNSNKKNKDQIGLKIK